MKLEPIYHPPAGEQNAPAAPPGPAAAPFIGPLLPDLISRHELARRLKKSLRTINYWQRRGILPYVKCGRSVYFKWTDVETHLHKNFRACAPSSLVTDSNRLVTGSNP